MDGPLASAAAGESVEVALLHGEIRSDPISDLEAFRDSVHTGVSMARANAVLTVQTEDTWPNPTLLRDRARALEGEISQLEGQAQALTDGALAAGTRGLRAAHDPEGASHHSEAVKLTQASREATTRLKALQEARTRLLYLARSAEVEADLKRRLAEIEGREAWEARTAQVTTFDSVADLFADDDDDE